MKAKERRPERHQDYLMSRKLQRGGLTDQSRQSIVDQIDQLAEIDTVSIVDRRELLLVSTGSSRRGMDRIEEIVQAQGCRFVRNWWSRAKLGQHRNADSA